MTPQIIDTFGRAHTYLRISLTDRCNLRCFYCMPEEGIELADKSHIMSLEEIVRIAERFVHLGVDTIRLTGGEPLIRRNLEFLVRELAGLGVTLKLTTNGILLDKYFDLFEEVGLRNINISLDTLDKTKSLFISKRDYYDRIMDNLKRAIDYDFNIKLNMVLIRGVNEREINDFIALTRDQDIAVKFIEYMPFKGNRWEWDKVVGKDEILEAAQSGFSDVEKLADPAHSTSASYAVKGFTGSFGIVSTITHPFCSGCNRIRLSADGKMRNCLFAASETDLLTPLRNNESIDPIILNAIKRKKFSRDGMNENMEKQHYERNRTMTSIGG